MARPEVKERQRNYHRAWQRANREQPEVRARRAKLERERKRRGGSGSQIHLAESTKAALYARDGGLCGWCGDVLPLPPDLYDGCLVNVDHITAVANGGQHEFDNWQLLHAFCNRSKQAKSMDSAPSMVAA